MRLICLILLVLLASCTNVKTIDLRKRFSGDHTTFKIREMWAICYQARIRAMPFFPPPIHMQQCDCMIDKSRERYSTDEYKSVGQEKLTKFYEELHDECEKESGLSTQVAPEPA